uniref:Negative elongation factor E n=1 Tax=Acrobeloides nanus TaxID=290746 RepID=A0A914CAC3_9BILA
MNFPTQLTAEEKELKEMFEKLKRMRKAIELATKGPTGSTANPIVKSEAKTAKSSIQAAEVATEEVKKKIISGMITVKKVDAKQTFKRAKNLAKKQSTINSSLEMDQEMEGTSQDTYEAKPLPKLLQNVPNMNMRGPTLYIRSYDLQTDSLNSSFERFGAIKRLFIEDRRRSAFLTFSSVEEAEKAMKETDGMMINGTTIRVSFARRQNQESFEQQRRFNRTSISLDSDPESSPTKSIGDPLFSPLSSPQKVNLVPEFNRGGNEITRGRGSGGTRRAGAGRARGFGNSHRGRKESSEMRSRSPLNLKQDDVSPVKRETSFSQHEQHSQQNLIDHDTVYDLDHSSQRIRLPNDESNHDDGSGRQLVTYDDDDSLFS